MLRRVLVLGVTVLSVGGLVGQPMAVRGQELPRLPISDTIVFTGRASITGDAQANCGPGGVANPGEGDVPGAVDLVGGCGLWSLTVVLGCLISSDPDPDVAVEVSTCDILTLGTFINRQCATGSADGTAATVNSMADNLNIVFHIEFVAGIGQLTTPPNGITGTSADGPAGAQRSDGSEGGTGVVLLEAPSGVDFVDTFNHVVLGPGLAEDCVTGFTVVGVLSAIEGSSS